jgi:hypothetical protein
MASSPIKNISLPPTTWGPIFWNTIHIVTLGYPIQPTEEDKVGARKFFESLTTVIPCPICREHYKIHLKEMPIDDVLESRTKLITWGWELHNRVNEMLGKRSYSMNEFVDHIQSLGDSKTNPTTIALSVVAGIAVGAGAYYAYQKYLK